MASPLQIYSYLNNYFEDRNLVKKKNISALVTTGPTREYLDPVRYISNESSGKQGYEVALALSKLGVKTTLVAGPSELNFSKDLKVKKVISGKEMLNEVKKLLPVDIAVCVAAVSDFKPKFINKKKIKKDYDNLKTINLEKKSRYFRISRKK